MAVFNWYYLKFHRPTGTPDQWCIR